MHAHANITAAFCFLYVAEPPSNSIGTQTSKSPKFSVGKNPKMNHTNCVASITIAFLLCTADPPRITTHPKKLQHVVARKPARFTVHVTGTEPLSYQWQHKPRGGREGWQCCEVERFPGADSSTLTIPSAHNSNEGSYRCTVSNCAGSETSESGTLTLGELVLSLHVYTNEHSNVHAYLQFFNHTLARSRSYLCTRFHPVTLVN